MDFAINAIYTLSLTALFSLAAGLALYLSGASKENDVLNAIVETVFEPIFHMHAEEEHERQLQKIAIEQEMREEIIEERSYAETYQRAMELEQQQREALRTSGYPNIIWIGDAHPRTQSKHAS